MVAYDNRYSKEFSICSIRMWSDKIRSQILEGIALEAIGTNGHCDKVMETNVISKEHPGYLHFLF